MVEINKTKITIKHDPKKGNASVISVTTPLGGRVQASLFVYKAEGKTLEELVLFSLFQKIIIGTGHGFTVYEQQ